MVAGLGKALSNTVTYVTKPDVMGPIIGLEGTVVAGRTKKAYNRGGVDEARERVIEETSGSLVWLGGVKLFNWIGNKIIGKVLGIKGKDAGVDVGQDAVRKPFNNFLNNPRFNPKNFSEHSISLMKFGKVAASIIAANYIIGFIVPKFNHKLTNYFTQKDKDHMVPVPHVYFGDLPNTQTPSRFDYFKNRVTQQPQQQGNVQFKGFTNTFTNFIENTNAGQLLSTDLGVLGGRTYNARKKEEKTEIAVRDGGSIYFYMFAQDHVRAGLNKLESGRWTRLDPNTVNIMHSHFENMFTKQNPSMSLDEFKQKVYGTGEDIDLNKFFADKKQGAITLDHFNTIETNPDIQARAKEMSTLQPTQNGVNVLARDQVADIYKQGELNNPKLIKEVYEGYTKGASSNPNKYVNHSKLRKLHGRMKDYVDDICKAAEKNGGKVDMKLLKKMKNKNLAFNGVNFLAGFSVAAMFLSKFIPDLQYWITRKTTGVNAFPGTYNYNEQETAKKSAA